MPRRGSRPARGRRGRLELDPREEHSRNVPRRPWYRRLTLLEMLFWVWHLAGLLTLHGPTLDPDEIDRGDLGVVVGLSLFWILLGAVIFVIEPQREGEDWRADSIFLLALGALHLAATLDHLVRRGWPSK